MGYPWRRGTEFVAESKCDCTEQRIEIFDDDVYVVCPHYEPYILPRLNEDCMEKDNFIPFEDF
jgi:hypothetical protein